MQFNGSQLGSEETGKTYHVSEPFRQVLETLPDDSVPRALVLLGLLTEQLEPPDGDRGEHVQIAAENCHKAPPASVPLHTVRGIQWLLSQTRDSLDRERKQAIGTVIDEAGLNTPAESSGDFESSRDQSPTDDTSAEHTDANAATDDPESGPTEQDGKPCEDCGLRFQDEGALMAHTVDCDERPSDARYTCKHCGNEYISEGALADHLEDCPQSAESTRHKCSHCGDRFETWRELREHKSHECSGAPSGQSRSGHERAGEREVTGPIIDYDDDDGYGFVTTTDIERERVAGVDGTVDVFFHVSDYPGREPREGEHLQFEVRETDEGLSAENTTVIDSGSAEPWDETFASTRPRWGRDN